MDDMQADMVMERSWKFLYLQLQAATRKRHQAWLEHLKPQNPPALTHFLQQGHTNFNKAPTPNIATPYEPMGGI